MADCLRGEPVKQFGVRVIIDVVKIDKTPDQIVLKLFLNRDPVLADKAALLSRAERLNENFVIDGLRPQMG